jgi:sulfate adenylyltransferase
MNMDQLVPPHGGELRILLVEQEARKEISKKAKSLKTVRISSKENSDLLMLGMGAFSPLNGFMKSDDYHAVVNHMHLADGTLWPMPITLAVTKEDADAIAVNEEITLVNEEDGQVMAVMTVEEKYSYDKKIEAKQVFRTEDENHPGVAKIYAQPGIYLGGPVRVVNEGSYPAQFGGYYARPAQTRALFKDRGWHTIAAFQTRNPIHRSHEYVTKIALEVSDGLFIHPLVGKLKAGDIPADIRMKCYEVLLENYYPRDRVVCRVYPLEMRYGGPREAVLHAIFRQNFGCSHLIVGRDHAGVGNYYGPFDAQKIFEEIADHELAIKPLNIDWTFWCYKCEGMASMKTCPHDKADRLLISGTKLREMLEKGEKPAREFSRPEVIDILIDYYQNR